MHKMATRRSGKVDTAARDIESPEDARNAAEEVDDKNKPSPRRFKCVHALVIIAVLVMSLDAYLQLNESRTNAPSAAEAVANVVKTTPEAAITAPNLGSLESLPAVSVLEKGAQSVETGNAPTQDFEQPQPQQSPPRGERSRGRKGRPRRRPRDRPAQIGPSSGATNATGQSVTGLSSPSQGAHTNLKEALVSILKEGGFTPTLCKNQDRSRISSRVLMTRASVDPGNMVNFVKVDGSHGRVQLDDDFVKLLSRSNFLERDGGVCHKTCAIVGNSGTMLGKIQGDEIDAHEAVMRINYPPTRRFEKQVGTKTTYDFSNRENARRMLRSGRFRWRSPKTKVIFFEGSSPVNRRTIFGPLLKKHPEQDFGFLHPHFVTSSQSLWFKMKKEIERSKGVEYHNKPMSGIYGVLFMLQICDEVDMYGFEAYTKRSKDAPYHYFDSVKGVTSVHSFDLAIDVFKALGSVQKLNLK